MFRGHPMSEHKPSNKWSLALCALGVVFGDIGTSPLYALRECLHHAPSRAGDELAVLGPISLMFWSLAIMVSGKYLGLLTRATNQGEGGMFSLLSLLRSAKDAFTPRVTMGFTLVGMFGACLLYGDGMITPAISVLAAVEGLVEIKASLAEWVIPISVIIIIALFMVQRYGTEKIGVAFGPIMILWFLTLGILGAIHISDHIGVFAAVSPTYGYDYLCHHGKDGLVIMGMVLLAVTGCEALYADIGHFGRPPLIRAWYVLVYPSLILNYMGQGALVISDPSAQTSPFFRLVPDAMLAPVIILATLSTIIASQAMITGVFSLTQQAVQLGFLPRLKIVHTSTNVRGQIYMPQVNYLLMIACLALVLGFKTSSNLAAAYGLSVCLEMTITSVIFFFVCRQLWHWPVWKAALPVTLFLCIELGYVGGSMLKFKDGAWFPLMVALCVWMIMKTWTDGRAVLRDAMMRGRLPVSFLIDEIKNDRVIRVPGTAVFMSAAAEGLPLCLLHHLKHNKALHKQVVLMSVKFDERPKIEASERTIIEVLHDDFYRVVLHYGFAEAPNVFDDLVRALSSYGSVKPGGISFYQSRELLHTTGPGKMMRWRKGLFALLSRMARPATGYFELPPRQVIELGIQLEL
jgi:KUP system potassium uptake protein